MDNLWYHAYKASLAMEPVALDGAYVRIQGYKNILWRRVLWHEVIPPFQCCDMGGIAAQTLRAKFNVVNLELNDEEFGQWRFFPLDPIELGIYLPAGAAKWQLKNIQVRIDQSIVLRDPILLSTEIFTWEDERPAFEPRNYSDYALVASRVIATGVRFIVGTVEKDNDGDPDDAVKRKVIEAKLVTGQLQWTNIPCAGRASSQ